MEDHHPASVSTATAATVVQADLPGMAALGPMVMLRTQMEVTAATVVMLALAVAEAQQVLAGSVVSLAQTAKLVLVVTAVTAAMDSMSGPALLGPAARVVMVALSEMAATAGMVER